MATEQVDTAVEEVDLLMLCRAVADASPMPMAGLGGSLHTLRYVNLAFCLLTGKSKDELIGTTFCGITPGTNDCISQCLGDAPRCVPPAWRANSAAPQETSLETDRSGAAFGHPRGPYLRSGTRSSRGGPPPLGGSRIRLRVVAQRVPEGD